MCPAINTVTIPESVRFFFLDNNRTLITEFDLSNSPPPPFNLEEVVSFFQAKRNAALCKMDLFQFMAEAYQKTWLPALGDWFSPKKVKDLSFETADEIFSHAAVWKDKFHALSWDFASTTVTGAQVRASCYIASVESDLKLCACFYVCIPDNEWINEAPNSMHLDNCWEQNAHDDTEYCLKKEFCPSIRGKASLDLSGFTKKTMQALNAVNGYLRAHSG
ncbi:hypothetical protein [Desulfovibrio sp. MES5]|uniref:hypothetical protein n=1 Tax=Desulfovibrio sp. MES5 TaxID=1899016 RepID=UPI0025C4E181|nr:hypothetical protein [Desulfovibrio sp. MES5]